MADLGAKSVVEEQRYFDRDYLAEFTAFYGTSARGYGNVGRRIHFFAEDVSRGLLSRAVGGDAQALAGIQNAYLGFTVLRPIAATPLGRTVLKWYEDRTPTLPRVVRPSRDYGCNVAGIKLHVRGLAWQQQDSAVGACATVALWTMMHSSAFDDQHAIPTTAAITRHAHRTASLGSRVFPSSGLSHFQLMEAVKECGLAPMVFTGKAAAGADKDKPFDVGHFASSVAACIRSGYPVLITGQLGKAGKHAVCAVGFRECAPLSSSAGDVQLQDAAVKYLYIHDDNLGPSVRFEIVDAGGVALLKTSPPVPRHPLPVQNPTADYPTLTPTVLIAAVHEDLRTSANALHLKGIAAAKGLISASGQQLGLTLSTRFTRLASFLDGELGTLLQGAPMLLARVRLALWEQVPPMSLHIGLVRIGIGNQPVLDILYDTSDSDRNLGVFCHIVYDPRMRILVDHVSNELKVFDFGVAIDGF